MEPVAPEPIATEVVPEPPKVDAQRFAAVAKRERALQAERAAIKAEREQFEAQKKAEAAERAEYARWKAIKANAKMNPLEYLQEGGIDVATINEFVLNEQKPSQESQVESLVESRLEAFKREQAEHLAAEKAEAEKQAAAEREQVLANFRKEVTEYVTSNSEKYELINLYGRQDAVAQTIELHFSKTHKVLSHEEAASLVEEQLVELVSKANETKKLKAKAQPPAPPVVDSKTDPKPRTPTLSNQLSSTPSTTTPALTEADRIKRAVAALDKR